MSLPVTRMTPRIRRGASRSFLRLVCAALPALLAAACARPAPVILLTVDALRADHLSTYGYERKTDPALSALAADSVVFTRAFTPRPKTTPAYASMLTGLYPYRHGLRTLGEMLAPENRTLAEALLDGGYETGGFVSSTVMIGRLSGLDQGFAAWDDLMPSREDNRENYERKAEATVAAALAWLESAGERPFLFLHLIDPHGPYSAPAGFAPRFSGGGGRVLPRKRVPHFQRLPGARTLGDYVDAYDTEIAYADRELGRIIEHLRKRGLYESALIIVTADHGESLGEHGVLFKHGLQLHDATTRVPLVVKPPGRRASRVAAVWDGAVSLTDVFSTALDYSGLEIPAGLDGRSLRPILEGRGGEKRRVVFSEKVNEPPHRFGAHDSSGSVLAKGACGQQSGGRCAMAYYETATDPGQTVAIRFGEEFVRLSKAALDFARAAYVHELPFSVERSYDAGDKRFVSEFVREHNSEAGAGPANAYTAAELDALRSLGYVED